MFRYFFAIHAAACVLLFAATQGNAANHAMRHLETGTNGSSATLRVFADEPCPYRIPTFITGKFAEHLGENIYGGMFAQILRNPTLADYPFASHETNPDGVMKFYSGREDIARALREFALRWGWPESQLEGLTISYSDGLAAFWTRQGPQEDVLPSPDTGPYGGRAQRVQVKAAGEGIAQWTYLPLHRVREFKFEIFVRSPDETSLSISLTSLGAAKPATSASIHGVSTQWQKFSGSLQLDPALPSEAVYQLALTADGPGQFLVQHIFLQPADNIAGGDPDIIRLLRESHLPLLRWPGGNFASTYHWQDGIGSVDARPTKPNYAWGAIEPDLFGTDEFIEFCRAAGCEPMLCLNAGNGTPQEAAHWVEYCNGSATSPMGKLRAANGHPNPYNVKYWEVGNELWGRWQFHWTTAGGYVDRYKQFVPALLEADPSIQLFACGAPVLWGKPWNDTLIAGTAPELRAITDHPLIGGTVSPQTDPLDIYRDFMAVPEILEAKWSALRSDMLAAGIKEPHLAVTELQLFAHLGSNANPTQPARLTQANMPSQATITEALYDILVYHAAIRLSPFVELITHSAIVNHGGGLRKEKERVFANPCYYAQSDFSAFANSTPVPVEIVSSTLAAPRVIGELGNFTPPPSYSAVDALAALTADGDLLISIVNRDVRAIHLTTELAGFNPAAKASLRTLQGSSPSEANTLADPDAIQPKTSAVDLHENKFELDLSPYSIVQLRIARRR
jgi:alpha-N-arabinofuranosidase